MHPLDKLFKNKQKEILSVYFTAGYPKKESISTILELLHDNGADLVEVGLPFSDPLADGPVIQHSSQVALSQGINIKEIFRQMKQASVDLPLVLMGYFNPVLQYGFEDFLLDAAAAGACALILPDLPAEVFVAKYASLYEKYKIYPVFLISPQTSDQRIQMLDSLSKGFIYAVSSSSTTGKDKSFGDDEKRWFDRINALKLRNPVLAGFGIHDFNTLHFVFGHLPGAVVGSAFIKNLKPENNDYGIPAFMNKLLKAQS